MRPSKRYRVTVMDGASRSSNSNESGGAAELVTVTGGASGAGNTNGKSSNSNEAAGKRW